MLSLSRKRRERIRIGKDVVVTVLRIGTNKVQLGIEAPGQAIVREELAGREGDTESTGATEGR